MENDIGKRIAQLRFTRQESQQQLADSLGIRRERIAQWENGTREIKAKNIIDLANHFEITADFILGIPEYAEPKVIVLEKNVLECSMTELAQALLHKSKRIEQ